MQAYDKNGDGTIMADDLYLGLRGHMTPLRRGLVGKAFNGLKLGATELQVPISRIKAKFNPEAWPEIARAESHPRYQPGDEYLPSEEEYCHSSRT